MRSSTREEHQLDVRDQMISPENMHTSNIIQTGQVIVRNTHIHVTTINENEVMNVKEGYTGGKGEMM